MTSAPAHDTDETTSEPPASSCAGCARLTAEVERMRQALVEIRRWTIEATHP